MSLIWDEKRSKPKMSSRSIVHKSNNEHLLTNSYQLCFKIDDTFSVTKMDQPKTFSLCSKISSF